MSDRNSFIFYRSFYEAISPLPQDEKLELLDAIIQFALNQTETELKPISKAMFCLIKPQLNANITRFENGKKGGRPKTETKPNNNLTVTEPKANKNVNANVNENVNVNKNLNENKEGFEIPNFIDLEIWNDFLEMRKLIKKPATERAQKNILKTLGDFYTEGINPNECLNQSITNNWQDIYKPKNKTYENSSKHNPRTTQQTFSGGKPSVTDAVNATLDRIKAGEL